MFRNYLFTALRVLRRNRVYSSINILGFAFGIACVIGIGLFVYDELSVDRFHVNYHSIYRIVERKPQTDATYNVAGTPGPLAGALKKEYPEVVNSVRVGRKKDILRAGESTIVSENILVSDPSLFDVFSFKLITGNIQNVLTRPDEIIITETTAGNLFGASWRTKEIIGSTINYGADQQLQVTAIIQDAPAASSMTYDAILPFAFEERVNAQAQRWNSNNYFTYLQLKPKSDVVNFETEIQLYLKKHLPETKTILLLQPLKDVYLKSNFDFDTDWGKRSNILYVQLFSLVGIIVLLIAAANFINLTTARAVMRAREVGVRKVIGAERKNLVMQFLVESVVLTSISILGALVIVQFGLPFLNDLAVKQITLPFREPTFWIALASFAAVLGISAGMIPSLYMSAFKPIAVLKGIFTAKAGSRFRNALVVSQFSLSILLAVGAIVIYRQLNFIQQKNLGFDKSHLLYIHLEGELKNKIPLFKNDLQALPGVAGISSASETFINSSSSTTEFAWQGKQTNDQFLIYEVNMDEQLIKTTGLTLAAGRNFSNRIASDSSSDSGAYLLNETAARKIGWTPAAAVGRKVSLWGKEGEVIGVVRDFHYQPLHSSIEPLIMRYRPAEGYSELFVKVSGVDVKTTVKQVASIYRKYEPIYPMKYGFVEQDLETLYEAEQRTSRIVMLFAVLAIVVSCLGLFGLTTFYANQRVKEIGIRKLLGSSVANIVGLLSATYLRLVLLAVLLATPLAWALSHKWLQNYAYRVAIDWRIFVAVSFCAVMLSFVTVVFLCIRAARANPVKSIRNN